MAEALIYMAKADKFTKTAGCGDDAVSQAMKPQIEAFSNFMSERWDEFHVMVKQKNYDIDS